MNALSEVPLTALSRGGGCGCEIAPAALAALLAAAPRLLVRA